MWQIPYNQYSHLISGNEIIGSDQSAGGEEDEGLEMVKILYSYWVDNWYEKHKHRMTDRKFMLFSHMRIWSEPSPFLPAERLACLAQVLTLSSSDPKSSGLRRRWGGERKGGQRSSCWGWFDHWCLVKGAAGAFIVRSCAVLARDFVWTCMIPLMWFTALRDNVFAWQDLLRTMVRLTLIT